MVLEEFSPSSIVEGVIVRGSIDMPGWFVYLKVGPLEWLNRGFTQHQ